MIRRLCASCKKWLKVLVVLLVAGVLIGAMLVSTGLITAKEYPFSKRGVRPEIVALLRQAEELDRAVARRDGATVRKLFPLVSGGYQAAVKMQGLGANGDLLVKRTSELLTPAILAV